MENELSYLLSPGSIFRFPFSIFHLSSGDWSRPLRKLTSSVKSSPVLVIAAIAAAVSFLSFLYFFEHGMTNVYGDGVAHVNIARKVVDSPDDSLWRRYIQIGSPWLPLQTVSMLPLVANDWMWRTAAAGSLVSMIAFVVAALTIYLVARSLYGKEESRSKVSLPLISAAVFIFNPSALYLQSTPMSELVFMGALGAAVCLLQRWVDDQTPKRLAMAGLAMTFATSARYEAWPVTAISVAIVALLSTGRVSSKVKTSLAFAAIVSIGPLYWLWHNWAIYGNALEFLTGPNSARGIYLRNRAGLGWSEVFVGHAVLDVLVITVAAAVCSGPLVVLLAVTGLLALVVRKRKGLKEHLPLLLLVVPFVFEVFSLYRGEIQIFPLSAFGLTNVRYGLPHLLAVALFAPAAVLICRPSARRWMVVAVCAIVGAQYWYLISEGPDQLAIYQEGYRNGVNASPARDRARLASLLRANPPGRSILMHTGALGPVVSQGGLRFSDIIHEGTLRWHQLDDGIPRDVATVLVQEGDPLDLRIRTSPALTRDLARDFQQQRLVGNIRLFERRADDPR